MDDSDDEPLAAEHPEIPREHALRGFAGVRAYALDPQRSAPLLERVLGASSAGEGEWELRGDARGARIVYDPRAAEPGRQSAGPSTTSRGARPSPSTRPGRST